MAGPAYRRFVPLTIVSVLRLPQCEQRSRPLRSGTVVAGAISLGQPRVGLDLVAAPHDQPQINAAALPSGSPLGRG
jgi:hypothetical protein